MTDTVPEPASPSTGTTAPATTPSGAATAAVLLACMTPPVLVGTIIAPVQPQIVAAFADTPGVAALVPALITGPGLVVGLLAAVAGRIVDRVGRVRLLVGALVFYSVVGMLPLWLESLESMVVSRLVVGVADAMIFTCTVALTADHFGGARRDRIFGLQTVVTSVAAVVFLAVGGALGALSWRAPFAVHLVGVVLAVLVLLVVREPAGLVHRAGPQVPLSPMPWRSFALRCAVTVVCGLVFATPLVELSYKLAEVGVSSPAVVGLMAAAASVGTAVGALAFARVAKVGTARLLRVSAGLAGVGIAVIGLGSSAPVVLLGAVVGSAGCGLLLPTVLTWALSGLGLDQRGRGSGWWTTFFSVAQFFLPLLVLALSGPLGGLSTVLVGVATVALLLAVVGPALVRRAAAAAG